MGAAKRDLAAILEWLDRGYVVVSERGINAGRIDLLLDDGYDVVGVYPPSLESARKKLQNKNKVSKGAHRPVEEEEK